MARPKNQAARRRELVDAAKRAIAERGISGLRAVDVAARTELSPASVAYYYPDLEELVREVHRDEVERFYWSRKRETEETDDPRRRLRRMIRSGIPGSRDDIDFQVLNELHTHAYREPYHARLMAELYEREASLYAEVLEHGSRAGAFDMRAPVALAASNLVALEDAYGLHLMGGSPLDADRVYALIVANAEVLTGCEL